MKASMQFISDFTTLPKDVKTFCDAMTMSGSKVEAYEITGSEIEGVYTGKIKEIQKHPDADKLIVCQVDAGQDEMIQIVTGATNVQVGDIVPVAMHLSKLPGGVQIKKGKLRGVESAGMLCSIDELGSSTNEYPDAAADGIYVLPKGTPVGVPIQQVLGMGNAVIEFEITSNRPDCFSVEGLGREAAITFGQEFNPVVSEVVGKSDARTKDMIDISIEAPDLCYAYHGCVVTDVVIAPSPAWLQERLRDCGVKPINNIVDITNYVMLELGQPMHAFDYRTLQDKKLIVRRAVAGERLTTLDDNEHVLDEHTLVIADGTKAIALAGVMGGKNSEVEDDTTTILFESAVFEPVQVRKSAMKAGLRTEASSRYEKGLDVQNAPRALRRACELVEQLGCGKVTPDPIFCEGDVPVQHKVRLRPDHINAFLGTAIEPSWMEDLVEKIGCKKLDEQGMYLMPSFRPDLVVEADLAEEVARFYGYNNIPSTSFSGKEATQGGRNPVQRVVETAKDVAIGAGFYEICTYTFSNPGKNDLLCLPQDAPERQMVKLRDAGEDDGYMRTSMLPSILQAASGNYRRGLPQGRLFELGYIYLPEQKDEDGLPLEVRQLVALSYDGEATRRSADLFYQMKGLAMELTKALGLAEPVIQVPQDVAKYPFLHPYRSAELLLNNEAIGYLGYIHPQVAENFEVTENLVILLFTNDEIIQNSSELRSQKPLPKYPPVTRDLAVVVNERVLAGDLQKAVQEVGAPFLESSKVFDVYVGERIGEGLKSVAMSLVFRKADGTLQDDDINPIFNKITERLAKDFDAKLRS